MSTSPPTEGMDPGQMHRAMTIALILLRDYYWTQSNAEGRRVDKRARTFLEGYFPDALKNGEAPPPMYHCSPGEPRDDEAAGQVEHLGRANHRLNRCLQAVMADLADLLDADQFNNIEARVLAAGVPYPPLRTDPRLTLTKGESAAGYPSGPGPEPTLKAEGRRYGLTQTKSGFKPCEVCTGSANCEALGCFEARRI